MGFQKHETYEQKLKRRIKYQLASSKFDCNSAKILRDWTDSKLTLILLGKAKPIFLKKRRRNKHEKR